VAWHSAPSPLETIAFYVFVLYNERKCSLGDLALCKLNMLFATKLKGFIEYWSLLEEHKHLNPTVGVLKGVIIGRDVKVGRYTYIGANSAIHSGTIGAFYSVSTNVVIGGDDHSMNAVSTHPFWCAPSGWTFPTTDTTERWTQPKPAPVISNDVWIGANAVVLRGAVIEDGAVIGAGAVVSGNIPAYAIAVGVPAKVLRYRFPADVCERLRDSKWWEWEKEHLEDMRSLFGSVEEFLNAVNGEQYTKAVHSS
jgi:acetyltransferase-like isoleucine patch superfamily enzyme